jgi:hypothetical protein
MGEYWRGMSKIAKNNRLFRRKLAAHDVDRTLVLELWRQIGERPAQTVHRSHFSLPSSASPRHHLRSLCLFASAFALLWFPLPPRVLFDDELHLLLVNRRLHYYDLNLHQPSPPSCLCKIPRPSLAVAKLAAIFR